MPKFTRTPAPSKPQDGAASIVRLAQVSAGAIFAVGSVLYAVSRFFKGPACQPLAPVDLAHSYGTGPMASSRTMAMVSSLTPTSFLLHCGDPPCGLACTLNHAIQKTIAKCVPPL